MSPWPSLLRLAATRYGIAPHEFWRLSLAEWRALTAEPTTGALTRTAFNALVQRFLDDPA